MRTILGACALMLALAAPAVAQQHGDHGDHMAMVQPGTHAALMHRQELGLSADQVARLTAADAEFVRAMREHCAQVRAAGGHNAQTHATMHEQMTTMHGSSRRQAEAILTADQRAKLDGIHAAHHRSMAGHDMAAMHHDSAAHHDMAAMHAQHGGAAPSCSANGACTSQECADCCKEMGCCAAEGEHGEHAHHGS
ncbi:MAG TPA: hypothetical protein VF092_18460 [Longimicrobium sp.]